MTAALPMPHDANAEATVIGACVVDNAVISGAQAMLTLEDFYLEKNRRIWSAMMALTERSEPVDLVTLRAQLQRVDALQDVGIEYLVGTVDGVPRISNVGEWCAIIRRHSQSRALIQAAHKLQAEVFAGIDPSEAIASMDALLHQIGAAANEGRGPLDNAALVREAIASIDARTTAEGGVIGYRTGLRELDLLLMGIRPGRIGVIAARLGVGKSILALNMAAAIARQALDKYVLFVTLEMDGVELMERRFAAEAGVSLGTLWHERPDKAAEAFGRLSSVTPDLSRSNLRIVEDAWTVPEIAQHARALRSERGLAAVFVDYFQLLDGTGAKRQSRTDELAGISRALRKLAKQLDVPIIVVAQLNREAADRKGGKHKAPEIHEIEYTDQLGKDAHWCVLIDPGRGQNEGISELYLRKNRGGAKGKCSAAFFGDLARFEDLQWGPAE